MRFAAWIFVAFAAANASAATTSTTKWSKEIPANEPEGSSGRRRRQFDIGDWVPLTRPCATCRSLADPGDGDIGLTPPRAPAVARQIHAGATVGEFFPRDESAILSVPPPPPQQLFSQSQVADGNLRGVRFPEFFRQLDAPAAVPFDGASVFTQNQFLSRPFLSGASLLGSNFPQVLPLLNNPGALLVQGQSAPPRPIESGDVPREPKVPDHRENGVVDRNRQQVRHQSGSLQGSGPATELRAPLPDPPVEFSPDSRRQQQEVLRSGAFASPPVRNATFPDVVIPGLDKEEIQLLYVPLETLKQRSRNHQIRQQQFQNQQGESHDREELRHRQAQQAFQQNNFRQQVGREHPSGLRSHSQSQQVRTGVTPTPQNVRIAGNQSATAANPFSSVPLPPSLATTPSSPATLQPSGHFITHSATPAAPLTTLFQQHSVTPSTLFFQHLPFGQSSPAPASSSSPESQTLRTFLSPSSTPLPQHFSSPFPTVSTSDNLVADPDRVRFAGEIFQTPKTIHPLTANSALDKGILLQDLHEINKLDQDDERNRFALQQHHGDNHQRQSHQKEQDSMKREHEERLAVEQKERERIEQDRFLRERQERERQRKLLKEKEEQERKKQLLEEKERERKQQQALLEQQERERKQQQALLEQQERERKQQQALLEQQERERKQQQALLEQRERELEQKLLKEKEEKEKQESLLREQQERDRQEKIYREQLERERQQQLAREKHEGEIQQKLLLQQRETERQQIALLQRQRQSEVRQKQILLQNRGKEQQFQAQLHHSGIDESGRDEQRVKDSDLSHQRQTTQHPSLVPHQPPLSIFYGSSSSSERPQVHLLLGQLAGAKTISVLDRYLENVPDVFVGPADLTPPKGYVKFRLPYLSNIDPDTDLQRFPFFVAPLNFRPPNGYSKIPFPPPHVGSVVVSSDSSLPTSPRSPPTTSPTFTFPAFHPVTTTDRPSPPSRSEDLHPSLFETDDTFISTTTTTTTPLPETTSASRKPHHVTKFRRPPTSSTVQPTLRTGSSDKHRILPSRTSDDKPNVKFPKQRRQRVKTTTAAPEPETLDSADRHFLLQSGAPSRDPFTSTDVFLPPAAHPHSPPFPTATERFAPTEPSVPATGTFLEDASRPFPTAFGAPLLPHLPQPSRSPAPETVAHFDRVTFGPTEFSVTSRGPASSTSLGASDVVGVTPFFDGGSSTLTGIESATTLRLDDRGSFSNVDGHAFLSPTEEDDARRNSFSRAPFASSGRADSDAGSSPPREHPPGTAPTLAPDEIERPTAAGSAELSPNSDPSLPPLSLHHENSPGEAITEVPPPVGDSSSLPATTTTPSPSKFKPRFGTKSRGQINFASSQTSTPAPHARKRIVYKSRKEHRPADGYESDSHEYRGRRKGTKATTLAAGDGSESVTYRESARASKPEHRRFGASSRRRKPAHSTTSENYPPGYSPGEYSASGVSNDVLDDQAKASTSSKSRYADASDSASTIPTAVAPSEGTSVFGRRGEPDLGPTNENVLSTENYPSAFASGISAIDTVGTGPATETFPLVKVETEKEEKDREREDAGNLTEKGFDVKKAIDPGSEKKVVYGRRRIRVRVQKRPREQIETAESQNLGNVANVAVLPSSKAIASEPDLYRFAKTGFDFDRSEKFAGTKNSAHVRNITSEILENTLAFSAPGSEIRTTDSVSVAVSAEEKSAISDATTAESTPEATETIPDEEADVLTQVSTTTESPEDTTYFTPSPDYETETEDPVTTTTTTTTPEGAKADGPGEAGTGDSREIHMSTATEISHETEICFRGKCIKTNSATADDDLRKLVQSADKILKT